MVGVVAVIRALIGLGLLLAWSTWLTMICVGSLFGLDVVNSSVGFLEAVPLGAGFLFLGALPFAALMAASWSSISEPETQKSPTPLAGDRALRAGRCGR
jgi:hypothetical protein